jgi:hypothetical protein
MNNKKSILLTILFTYIFVVAIRWLLFYIMYADNLSLIMQDGSFIPIFNSDGGVYGYYASNILSGIKYPFTSEYMPGYLLFFISKFFGISLNQVLFYSPLFLSSLVVIPIILIGYLINLPRVGVYASILGSFSIIYYAKTALGHYDSDVLNIFFIFMILFSLMYSLKTNIIKGISLAFIFIILFALWYHSFSSIVLFIIMVYIIYIFIASYKQSNKLMKYIFYIGCIFFILFNIINNTYYKRALDYFNQDSTLELIQKSGNILYFSSELAGISEAQTYNLSSLIDFLSIHNSLFLLLSFIGLLLLSYRYRYMIIFSIFSIFVFISMKAGMRFSIFGVFPIVFGLSYMIVLLEDKILKYKKILVFIPIILLLTSYIYKANITNEMNSSLKSDDFEALVHLGMRANKRDFIISSWSFGWRIWYLTYLHTLIDNGKHDYDKFILAKLLLSNEDYTAKATRYFLEKCYNSTCELALRMYHKKTPFQVDKEIKKVKKTKDIYFFLNDRMILSLNQMMMDLQIYKKQKISGAGAYFANPIQILNTKEVISEDFSVNFKTKTIKAFAANKTQRFNNLFIIIDNKIQRLKGDKNSPFNVIIYKDKFLIIVHNDILKSFFIQTMIFHRYDKKLFKLEYVTKNSIILKLND